MEELSINSKTGTFTFSEIVKITSNFERVIGKGGFGEVYFGTLNDGTPVAVKVLSPSSSQGYKEFLAEARLLTFIHHEKLVSLLGYSDEDSNKALIYDYMPNGNLKQRLSEKSWNERLQIAIDVAHGLEYLHGCNPPIVHRDLKPDNILFNKDMRAKIADFGLSRTFATESATHISTRLGGTIGYMDPESFKTGRVNRKSDVYSFGIILLQLVTGQPAVITQDKEDSINIVNWIDPLMKRGDIQRIVDPRLNGEFNINAARKATKIAISCVKPITTRPNSSHVLDELKECLDIEMRSSMLDETSWLGNVLVKIFRKSREIQKGADSKNSSSHAKDPSCSSSKFSSLSGSMPHPTEAEILQSSNLKSFSFKELKTATRNFRPSGVLGEGGFGCVFKGWIDENSFAPARPETGMVIAVKMLNKEGFQGHREWLAEINYLGQLYHPNLVKLIGYCMADDDRLLVYEFMPKGSLGNHLFRRDASHLSLSWNIRMKIALGAAKGLAFLHSDEAKVIHRDFKTSTVLLDSNYNAKLSGFGLAKDGPTGDESHVSTRVMGTYGYAAPEYMATGHLTARSDVYGFGVVLLEMLSGRRAVDNNRPSGEQILVEWARPYLSSKRKVFKVMDASIEGQYPLDAARKAAALALECISEEPKLRPSMNAVVKALEQIQESVVNKVGS